VFQQKVEERLSVLAPIAGSASRGKVGPLVFAAATKRLDVVNLLAGSTAVGAWVAPKNRRHLSRLFRRARLRISRPRVVALVLAPVCPDMLAIAIRPPPPLLADFVRFLGAATALSLRVLLFVLGLLASLQRPPLRRFGPLALICPVLVRVGFPPLTGSFSRTRAAVVVEAVLLLRVLPESADRLRLAALTAALGIFVWHRNLQRFGVRPPVVHATRGLFTP